MTDINYVIDSSGWIEYLSEGPLSGQFRRYIEKITKTNSFISTISVFEIYKKIRFMSTEEAAVRSILHIQNHSKVVEVNPAIAVEAAEISIMEKLSMADAIILSAARELDAKLITSDSDFKGKKDVIFIE